jgi:hypothetical protein
MEADVKDPIKQMCKAQPGDDEPTKKDWSSLTCASRAALSTAVFSLTQASTARRWSRAQSSRRRVAQESAVNFKPKAKDLTAAYKKPISFVGRDAESIKMLGVKLMNIVFPPAIRDFEERFVQKGARKGGGVLGKVAGALARAQ